MKKTTKILLYFFLYLNVSCQEAPHNVIDVFGKKYNSWNYNISEMAYIYLINGEVCEFNVHLELKPDSTYIRSNCGGISYGKVIVVQDSLFLDEYTYFKNVDSTTYENQDSLPIIKYHIQSDGVLMSKEVMKLGNGDIQKKRSRLKVAE